MQLNKLEDLVRQTVGELEVGPNPTASYRIYYPTPNPNFIVVDNPNPNSIIMNNPNPSFIIATLIPQESFLHSVSRFCVFTPFK